MLPSKFELLSHHIAIQTGIYLNRKAKLCNNLYLVSSPFIKDKEWNFCYGELNNQQELVKKSFKKLGLEATFYSFYQTENSLKEVWMLLSKQALVKKVISNNFLVKSLTKSEENLFLDIYAKAFLDGKISSPYLDCLKLSFQNKVAQDMNFIAYLDNKPVAIASLLSKNNLAGLYNVAVLPNYQGKGLGYQITQIIIEKAFLSGIDFIYLQTEQGSTVELFYQKMGFYRFLEGYFSSI